jgi:hypothetical protein
MMTEWYLKQRWFAVIPDKGFIHEMMPMQKEGKMMDLLNDPVTYNIRGIPSYYDEKGRVWPLPCNDVIITKTDQ